MLSAVQADGFVSGCLRNPVRLLDSQPPPRLTPRGDRGSWPGPGPWVHPGRTYLRTEEEKTQFNCANKTGGCLFYLSSLVGKFCWYFLVKCGSKTGINGFIGVKHQI